jgi:hypothetical protein
VFQTSGSIDIVPPLAWSELAPTGIMVMDGNGLPQVPVTGWVELEYIEQLLPRPEGTLHRFTFDTIVPAQLEIPVNQREVFRAQIATLVTTFPTHVFGGANRVIRFRGEDLDDVWRVRVNPDNTVSRQVAQWSWVDAP